jgi:hypothetical protein
MRWPQHCCVPNLHPWVLTDRGSWTHKLFQSTYAKDWPYSVVYLGVLCSNCKDYCESQQSWWSLHRQYHLALRIGCSCHNNSYNEDIVFATILPRRYSNRAYHWASRRTTEAILTQRLQRRSYPRCSGGLWTETHLRHGTWSQNWLAWYAACPCL